MVYNNGIKTIGDTMKTYILDGQTVTGVELAEVLKENGVKHNVAGVDGDIVYADIIWENNNCNLIDGVCRVHSYTNIKIIGNKIHQEWL